MTYAAAVVNASRQFFGQRLLGILNPSDKFARDPNKVTGKRSFACWEKGFDSIDNSSKSARTTVNNSTPVTAKMAPVRSSVVPSSATWFESLSQLPASTPDRPIKIAARRFTTKLVQQPTRQPLKAFRRLAPSGELKGSSIASMTEPMFSIMRKFSSLVVTPDAYKRDFESLQYEDTDLDNTKHEVLKRQKDKESRADYGIAVAVATPMQKVNEAECHEEEWDSSDVCSVCGRSRSLSPPTLVEKARASINRLDSDIIKHIMEQSK